jgi:LacI family transcriptional regulator
VVPRDFSIIGCDDVLGAVTFPALTSVSNHSADVGRIAISMLLDILRSRNVADVRYALDTKLVVRDTTTQAPSIG